MLKQTLCIVESHDRIYYKEGKFNLYPKIAEDAICYFSKNHIAWWALEQGKDKPTGHVLSSQISCINHLFPIRKDKEAVIRLLKTIDNDFVDAVPIECDTAETQGYIAFEVVCDSNYLNEIHLTRGANCTSIDALIIGKKTDGKNILVPIEWKYTESYALGVSADKSLGKKGKTRCDRYGPLILKGKYLKSTTTEVYHFEPFYQLMRQTLWAEQMACHTYADSTGFIHIHVIPEGNAELLKSDNRKNNRPLRKLKMFTYI